MQSADACLPPPCDTLHCIHLNDFSFAHLVFVRHYYIQTQKFYLRIFIPAISLYHRCTCTFNDPFVNSVKIINVLLIDCLIYCTHLAFGICTYPGPWPRVDSSHYLTHSHLLTNASVYTIGCRGRTPAAEKAVSQLSTNTILGTTAYQVPPYQIVWWHFPSVLLCSQPRFPACCCQLSCSLIVCYQQLNMCES